MPDPVTPALTPEEWTSGRHNDPGRITKGSGRYSLDVERFRDLFEGRIKGGLALRWNGDDNRIAVLEPEESHALAALCLYQQPFGFTREDVELLRGGDIDTHYAADHRAVGASLESLAARISALLPPEDPAP